MHLHHKLEAAITAWVEANRGDLFPGVTIIPAHATVEPPLPYLGVWCERAQPHPDFPGYGRGYPKLCPVVFEFRLCAEDALEDQEEQGPVDRETGQVHSDTIAKWLEALNVLLAGESEQYQALREALNIPQEGADTRAVKGLYVTAVHLGELTSQPEGRQWGEVLALEIIAQDRDPV